MLEGRERRGGKEREAKTWEMEERKKTCEMGGGKKKAWEMEERGGAYDGPAALARLFLLFFFRASITAFKIRLSRASSAEQGFPSCEIQLRRLTLEVAAEGEERGEV
jgi:hypothetical protein